jgi:transaldolase
MSKLFLDSAIFSDIDKMIAGGVEGVTTNPSLIAKNTDLKRNKGENAFDFYLRFLKQLVLHIPNGRHLSVEVISNNTAEMVEQAHKIRDEEWFSYTKDVAIKIPVTLDNLRIINRLSKNNVSVNATACINALQAKMAEDAGAKFVSFFYRRGLDANEDMQKNISTYCNNCNKDVKIICGSIRTPDDIIDCWRAGSDIVTAPFSVIEKALKHEQTDKAIEGFTKDIEKWLS